MSTIGKQDRCCGGCRNFQPERTRCAIGMSYAAFVYPETLSNDCPAWEAPPAQPSVAQQSQVRGAVEAWRALWGIKP